MKILIVFVLSLYCADLFGQRIDGVYYGEIVSPKNSMIVKSKDEQVTGTIYLNKSDTLNFSGSFVKNIFKATVYSKDRRAIVLEGNPERNAMWLKVLPDSNRRFLNKISNKTSYKIKRLYSENMDPMLLGRWESVKSVNKKGELSDGKMAYTYFDNNRMTIQLLSIPSGVHLSERISEVQILSQKMEYSWKTNGNELTETHVVPSNINPALVSRFTLPPLEFVYLLKHDTITMYGKTGGYTVFKKK